MGKKFKLIICIVFFPVTILFFICKGLIKIIDKIKFNAFLKNLTIKDIDGLDGHAFEKVMFELFKSAHLKVEQTRKSRDFGADLIINTKIERIVIQCKLYFNHNVGNSAIQEINTAKNYYDATLGVVITNSKFTKPAKTLAATSGIKIIDREELSEFLTLSPKQKKDYIETL